MRVGFLCLHWYLSQWVSISEMNTAWETHMALLCRSMAFFLRVNTLYSFVFAIVLDKAISKEVFFIRKCILMEVTDLFLLDNLHVHDQFLKDSQWFSCRSYGTYVHIRTC